MPIARRTLAALALVACTATGALAQNAGMTSPGGNSMRPAGPPVVRIERPSLRELAERLLARVQWRPTTTVVTTRAAAKRKPR